MNYLFLDLSTTSTGWCVTNGNKELTDYGCVQSSSSNIFKRITIIRDAIQNIIEQYNVDKIVAEEVHLDDFKNTYVYKVLTWLQGIVLIAAFEINPKIQYEFILPNTWRSKIGIKVGRSITRDILKRKDIEYVKMTYNIDANDDVCDAICLKDAYFVKEKNDNNNHKCAW